MASVFTQDWESQPTGTDITTSNGGGYTPVKGAADSIAKFDTTFAVNGSRCAALTTVTSANCYVEETFTLTSRRIFRRYVRVSAIGNLTVLFQAGISGTTRAQVRLQANGTLQIRNGTTGVGTSTTVLAANTTYRLEWWLENSVKNELRIHAGANLHSGTPTETVTNSTTYAGGTFDRFREGVASATANLTVWVDGDVDDDTTWPGPVAGSGGSLTATAPAAVAAMVGAVAGVFVQDWEGTAAPAAINSGNSGYTAVLGTDATATFSADTAVNGVQSGKLTTPATTTTVYLQETFASTSDRYFRRYVRAMSIPATNMVLLELRGSATDRAQVRLMAAGTLQIRNGVTAVATSTFVYTAGTTIRLEWHVQNTGANVLRIFHGGNLHGSTADETLTDATYAEGAFDAFRQGVIVTQSSMTLYFDADADSSTTWVGPIPVTTLTGVLTAAAPAAVAALSAKTVSQGYGGGYLGGYGSSVFPPVAGILSAVAPAAVAAAAGTPAVADPGLARTYRVLIDWDSDGGLDLGTFEAGTDEWAADGTNPPTLAQSTVRAYHGDGSLLITWATGGSSPQAAHTWTGLTAGEQYALSGWAWVPAGSPHVKWGVSTVGVGPRTTVNDAWQEFTFTFLATATTHVLQILPHTTPAAGNTVFVDHLRVMLLGEDVTNRVLARSPVQVAYGRDQVRSLAPAAAGRAGLEVDNSTGDYSPENTGSPLDGYLGPGRALLIECRYGGHGRTLYRGYLDDFDLQPDLTTRSVTLTALDVLAQMQGVKLSTALHQSVTTGQAVGLILDAAGWPADRRDIDPGATVIPWWWEDDTTAFDALQKLVRSEGPGALVSISAAGRFVFRGRHHRLQRVTSTAVQATFRGSGTEPVMSPPLVYDAGWKEIINRVAFTVEQRQLDGKLSPVWSDEATINVANGETVVVAAKADGAFHGAVTPVPGVDYTLHAGNVTVTLTRNSGQTTQVRITATGGPAVIHGLQVRAYALTEVRTVTVEVEDATSARQHGRRDHPDDAPWAGVHDATAVARMILAHRAQRLPVVSMRITGTAGPRIDQQLARDMSDRVRIIEPVTGINADFHVEQIGHTFDGGFHDTVFGCEKIPTQVTGVFILGSSANGRLGVNRLGRRGLDDPATMFVLGSATNGRLGTNVLAT